MGDRLHLEDPVTMQIEKREAVAQEGHPKSEPS